MIQKYFKVNASKEALRQELLAYEQWPEWWPGVQSVKVIKNEPALTVLDIVIKTVMTIKMTLELECRHQEIIKFRQIKGWFKSYTGDYTLLPSPDGAGVTIKVTTELESGMLVPKSMVYAKLSATFNLLEEALNKRLQGKQRLLAESVKPGAATGQPQAAQVKTEPVRAEPKAKKLAHLFPTKKGLEVWILGKRYLMKAIS